MAAARNLISADKADLLRDAGSVAPVDPGLSHNLNGQKLGRKGRVTRERILAATAELLAEGPDVPISLSAVARRASLGLTSLYLYFSDLTELLVAVLDPVMQEADAAYLDVLRQYWPDAELGERCQRFVEGFNAFWERHSRLLHLRNSMADQYDERMLAYRVRATQPVIREMVRQLGLPGVDVPADTANLASVLITGVERAVTVATDLVSPALLAREFGPRRHSRVVEPCARMLEAVIRDTRRTEAERLAAGEAR